MRTIQEKVLYEVFLSKKECSVDELSKKTGLKPSQVYVSIYHLIRRGFVISIRVRNKNAGYCNSPVKIFVKLDDNTMYKRQRLERLIRKINTRCKNCGGKGYRGTTWNCGGINDNTCSKCGGTGEVKNERS